MLNSLLNHLQLSKNINLRNLCRQSAEGTSSHSFIATILMPVFQMTAKSMRHQSCRTQFVSVQAYQNQLLHNDSYAITKMEMYEVHFQGRDNFDFASVRLHKLQGRPTVSPKAAPLKTKSYNFIGTQTC